MIGVDNCTDAFAFGRRYEKQSSRNQHHDPAARRRCRGTGPGEAPGTSARAGPRQHGQAHRARSRRCPGVPRRSRGLQHAARRRPGWSHRAVRVRFGRHRHAAQSERLSAARVLERQEVPRALPAARHWRRRDGMDPLRDAGRSLRQPDRRQSRGADDRRDPNGRALADDSATGNQFAPEKVAASPGSSRTCWTI